jgi:hypothetical protein
MISRFLYATPLGFFSGKTIVLEFGLFELSKSFSFDALKFLSPNRFIFYLFGFQLRKLRFSSGFGCSC